MGRLGQPFSLALAGATALLLAACSEEGEGRAGEFDDEAVPAELSAGQVARVHVVLQPILDQLEPEPALQVRGRFVEYRGMSEEFARGRADILSLPAGLPALGGCATRRELLADEPGDGGEVDRRELSFVDVGDLRLELGGAELVLSMALVPDVLPYLSGVEYFHADDAVPNLEGEPDGRAPVRLLVEGRSTVGVEAPRPIELTLAARGARQVFIEWRPPGSGAETMELRLQAFEDDSPLGEEVACLVADTGRAALDQRELEALGLAVGSDLVRVTAVRAERAIGKVDGFGEVELVVEVRNQALLPVDPQPE